MSRRIFAISLILGLLLFSSLISMKTPAQAQSPTATRTSTAAFPVSTSTAIPGADFVGTPLSGAAPLAVQFRHLNGGNLSGCTWTFGDGTTQSFAPSPGVPMGSCPTVTHTYANGGSFTVSLRVTKATNGFSNTMTKPNYIQVSGPTATSVATNSPLPDLTITSVTYIGSSPACANSPKVQVVVANIGVSAANGSFSVSLNGSAAQTVNGLAAGQSVTLIFSASSSTAIVDSTNVIAETNESNNSLSGGFGVPTQARTCTPTAGPSFTPTPTPTRTNTPSGPLSAEFVGSPLTGNAPLRVVFNATGNTDGTQSCTWLFGDGTGLVADFGCIRTVSHTYTNPGSYTVTFHVAGASDVVKQNYVVVSGGPSLTPTPTLTHTHTPGTPTRTPTQSTVGACSPVTSTITSIPFVFDGAGTFCWQASSLGGFINSWNTTSVSVNGMNVTNIWVGSGSYPAKIGGFYYVSYDSSVAWGHFEARP